MESSYGTGQGDGIGQGFYRDNSINGNYIVYSVNIGSGYGYEYGDGWGDGYSGGEGYFDGDGHDYRERTMGWRLSL